jgi:hypothetical protein
MLIASDRDTLTRWLRSYSEARQQQALTISRQATTIKQFFNPVRKAKRASTLVDFPSPVTPDFISSLDASPDMFEDDDSLYDEDSDEDSLLSSVLDYNHFCMNASSTRNAIPDLTKELDTG